MCDKKLHSLTLKKLFKKIYQTKAKKAVLGKSCRTILVFLFLDVCKTSPFVRFLRQAQISIFEIFLWLKFSPSLNSNKIEYFSKGLIL